MSSSSHGIAVRTPAPRGAESPVRLGPRQWLEAVKKAGKRFSADDCMGLAQEVAYSSLLAFFPAVIALVGLLDLLNVYDSLESFLRPVAPAAVLDILGTFHSDTGGGGSVVALVVGLLAATWAASGAMVSVAKAVNRAYEHEETRPFWKLRLIAIVLVFATSLVTIGTLLMIVFGGTLGNAVARQAQLGSAFDWTWNIARWPLAFSIVLLLFAVIYWLAPNAEPRNWRWISPGAVVGGVMWLALSGLFSLYTALSDSYTKTYGALAGGIVLLLWLNYSAWAILFGAELNAELEQRAGADTRSGVPTRR